MYERNAKGDPRERLLDAAERLFARRGYKTVTLRDIAREVGIHHSSVYHHVPGGKEELFVEVTERSLRHHRAGLERAIAQAPGGIRAALYAVAAWLLAQPPMDIVRLTHSDMPEINPAHARRLSEYALEALIGPIAVALERARHAGEIRSGDRDLGLAAGAILAMIESLYAIPEEVVASSNLSRLALAHDLIDMLLDGLRPRPPTG